MLSKTSFSILLIFVLVIVIFLVGGSNNQTIKQILDKLKEFTNFDFNRIATQLN